jgi:hypothetical protein
MDSTIEIRQLILKNVSSDVLRDTARRDGMKTLAEDGWRLVALGVTTVAEVLSVTTAKEVEATAKQAPPAEPQAPPREAHVSPVLAPARRADAAPSRD